MRLDLRITQEEGCSCLGVFGNFHGRVFNKSRAVLEMVSGSQEYQLGNSLKLSFLHSNSFYSTHRLEARFNGVKSQTCKILTDFFLKSERRSTFHNVHGSEK